MNIFDNMSPEERSLIYKDFYTRLYYTPCIFNYNYEHEEYADFSDLEEYNNFKVFLRRMSDMTSNEKIEFGKLMYHVQESFINAYGSGGYSLAFTALTDWLNEHHFDYRGLIDKSLALEAPEGMYKID